MKIKKIISLVLAVFLMCGIVFPQATHAEGLSRDVEVELRLAAIQGTNAYRNATYTAFNGKDLGSGCYAFTNAVTLALFGVTIPSQAKNSYGYWTLLNAKNTDWTQVGVAYGNSDVKELLKQARPGDIIQYRSSKADRHIKIILSNTSSALRTWGSSKSTGASTQIYDWEYITGPNKLNKATGKFYPSLGDFSIQGYGLSLYHCDKSPLDGAVRESPNGNTVVIITTKAMQTEDLATTEATMRGSVRVIGGKVTEVGMYFGPITGNMVKLGSDSGKASNAKNMWYNSAKCGHTLNSGTKYRYQAYAIVDQKEYLGNVVEFETPTIFSVSLNKSSLTMQDNVCVTLNATTNPSGQAVSWKSSNNSVVRVNNGNLEGAKAGTATITASMSYNGKTYSATCNVTVTASQTVCAKHTYTSSGGDCCTVCGYQYILPKTSVDKTMYAAEDEVVVRSAPYAVSSNIVKTVKKDDAVKISYSTTNSLGNQWYITSDGLYIYADRLTTTAPAPATSTSATAQATSPAKTPDTVTFSNYQVRELTSTSAEPYATATAKTGKVARVGMYIGTDKNNLTELGTDNGTPKNYKNMWYNTTKYNYPLKPSTTYYYQPFAEVDGERYYGDIKSFTTKEPESMVTFSNYKVRNLTATSAEPYATATAKSGKVARVGMYIGTDKNNLTQLGTDNGTPKPYKNMWYNTTKYGYTIKPNTTYYYQPFAEVDGVRYYGDIKSFTTPSK